MKEYVFIYEGIRSDTTYREKKFGSKLPNLPLLTQQMRQERGNNERCADH